MHAYATLVTNRDYALGATALLRSLRRTETEASILVLLTPAAANLSEVTTLERLGATLIQIAPLPVSDGFTKRHSRQAQHDAAPFAKGEKPAFHDPLDNFAKLRLWELDLFRRIVFLDADTLVVRNIDKLFGYPEFSAAPNLYETLGDMNRLNSGVFVAAPDKAVFAGMLAELDRADVFWRRTDQTFLETCFPDWHGLPYTYNTLQYVYFNLPALWHWPSIKVVHYQYEKPWMAEHPKREQLQPLIDLWWRLFEGGAPPEALPTKL